MTSSEDEANNADALAALSRWRDQIGKLLSLVEQLEAQTAADLLESASESLDYHLIADMAGAGSLYFQLVSFEVEHILCTAYAEAYSNDHVQSFDEVKALIVSRFRDLYEKVDVWLSGNFPSLDDITSQIEIVKSDIDVVEECATIAQYHVQTEKIVGNIRAKDEGTIGQAIEHLVRILPSEFIAFVLNASVNSFTWEMLTSVQCEVLAEIVDNLRRLEFSSVEEAPNSIRSALCLYDEDLGTTRATFFHGRCGGERPTITDSGTLCDVLKLISIDLVGARLCRFNLRHVIHSHPLISTAVERVKYEDEPILELFRRPIAAMAASDIDPMPSRDYYPTVNAYWSHGGGGTLHVSDVPANILEASVPVGDTASGVLLDACKSVETALVLTRNVACGDSVSTTMLVGLEKIYISNDVDAISMPSARLRQPTPFERMLSPRASEPTAIIEIDTEFWLLDVIPHGSEAAEDGVLAKDLFAKTPLDGHRDGIEHFRSEIEEVVTQVRFSVALASPENEMFGPVWLCTVLRNPMVHFPIIWDRSHPWYYSTTSSGHIDSGIAKDIEYWGARADEIGQSLKVGRRRLLQALSERSDPIDSFIDFVIAWENLVGSTENTTYIVAAAMALLIEPTDISQRGDIFAKVKRLYGFRSKLVHGSVGPDVEAGKFKLAAVPVYARDSGRLAIETFKSVLSRPDLVNLDSESRAKKVLVGFA